MGYIQSGVTNDLVVVDRTPAAMRATLRPNQVTGSYRASFITGTPHTTLANTVTFSAVTSSNGILFTFKNSGKTDLKYAFIISSWITFSYISLISKILLYI